MNGPLSARLQTTLPDSGSMMLVIHERLTWREFEKERTRKKESGETGQTRSVNKRVVRIHVDREGSHSVSQSPVFFELALARRAQAGRFGGEAAE